MNADEPFEESAPPLKLRSLSQNKDGAFSERPSEKNGSKAKEKIR